MKWDWIQAIGYVGSLLMFLTFFMKTMIPLRMTAIAANVVMITYTALAGVIPVLILQSSLLPLNIVRFIQMKRLITRVKAAARGDFKIEPLLPFMKHERHKDGDILFSVGDRGDRMYFLQSGRVRLREIDKLLRDGDVFGEIGLLSVDKERTATAVCEGDCDLYCVTQDVVFQLFYQKPEFSFFLVRLVTKRLLDNLEDAQFDAMATMGPQGATAKPAAK
ncbi:MAG: cyclic nucleotide-binding domain-containing protein [Deltaproteobacteria bacterium]|nr:cyclic nucleotide-binding domain-containing protein [Deltaproteobacteria bacterium]